MKPRHTLGRPQRVTVQGVVRYREPAEGMDGPVGPAGQRRGTAVVTREHYGPKLILSAIVLANIVA